MKALSIRQPWAWLILHAGKDIENRSWPTNFRGRVLIHAAKGMTPEEYLGAKQFVESSIGIEAVKEFPEFIFLQRGGIVGEAEIVDCVQESSSPWFCGQYGFVLKNAKPTSFLPFKGSLSFFETGYFPCGKCGFLLREGLTICSQCGASDYDE